MTIIEILILVVGAVMIVAATGLFIFMGAVLRFIKQFFGKLFDGTTKDDKK